MKIIPELVYRPDGAKNSSRGRPKSLKIVFMIPLSTACVPPGFVRLISNESSCLSNEAGRISAELSSVLMLRSANKSRNTALDAVPVSARRGGGNPELSLQNWRKLRPRCR